MAVMTTSTAAAPKALQIFRTGRHTATSGDVLAFSEAALQATAAAYDPARHEAPIVVGHPQSNGPAYGWVKSLAFADGGLDAEPHQVDPAFAELVEAGRFKKISASFYAPEAPANPVPGVYYLRHVGFLGAQPPAVKGLRSPTFAEQEEGVVEFSELEDVQNASLWRSLREWLIGKFGLADADQAIPGYTVSSVEQGAQAERLAAATKIDGAALPVYAEADNPHNPTCQESQVNPADKAALEAENAQLKAQIATMAALAKAAKQAEVHAAHAAFAETLVAAGKLLPAQVPVALATLDFFAAGEATPEFSEGDTTQPLATAFRAFLASLPKQVDFGENATREIRDGVDLADPVALARAAQSFQESEAAEGRQVSIAQAVAHLFHR